jgi:hypothetical protein
MHDSTYRAGATMKGNCGGCRRRSDQYDPDETEPERARSLPIVDEYFGRSAPK